MINEEKVILMTKLASYETHEGKKDMTVVHYFRRLYWFSGSEVSDSGYHLLFCLVCSLSLLQL